MRQWMKRLAAIIFMTGAISGLSAAHASADPGKLCARADIWVHPFTYFQQCVNDPGYPALPKL